MAPWILPALKAVLPHVGSIINAAKPVFTKKPPEATSEAAPGPGPARGSGQPGVVQQQIAELQAAASQNAANIRELAQQLQSTVAALEQAASVADSRLRRAIILAAASIAVALVSLGVAVFALLAR
jgi:hypothetical protein